MAQTVLSGDTIKLTAEFVNFGGSKVDPENITLKMMDPKGKQIGEIIKLGSSYRVAAGIYTYDYVVPEKPSVLVYEFRGLVNGKPILGRETLYVTLVKEG